MKHEFFADSIRIGEDEAEETYQVLLSASGASGGPPRSYLLLQRTISGADDPAGTEPYIEVDDAAYGWYASAVRSAELLPTYLHVVFESGAGFTVGGDIAEVLVRFSADAALLRKLRLALELVIGDAFLWRSAA